MKNNHLTEAELEKQRKDLRFIKVARIIIVCLLVVAAAIAAFVFIPNKSEDSEVLTIETPVTAIWESSQRKDLLGHAVEVHGTVTNHGWKPAFNVTYTIVVTSDYATNNSEEKLDVPVTIVEYKSAKIPILWGGETFSFEHTLTYDQYRDRNLDIDSDVEGKVLD